MSGSNSCVSLQFELGRNWLNVFFFAFRRTLSFGLHQNQTITLILAETVSSVLEPRETIRDDAVKFFVESGLLLRIPDDPNRPTNSGKTVYQIEPSALALLRKCGTLEWPSALREYLASREGLKHEIARKRILARVPATLPDGSQVALFPGSHNPLIKAIIE